MTTPRRTRSPLSIADTVFRALMAGPDPLSLTGADLTEPTDQDNTPSVAPSTALTEASTRGESHATAGPG